MTNSEENTVRNRDWAEGAFKQVLSYSSSLLLRSWNIYVNFANTEKEKHGLGKLIVPLNNTGIL